jgi:hypothetical protein
VNLIELASGQEDLRDTVFHSVFRADIVMDSDKAAKKYWESLLRCARDHPDRVPVMPTIYTLEGSRILADGRMQCLRETVEALPFVFGEKSAFTQDEYKNTTAELATIEEILPLLQHREGLRLKAQQLDEMIDEMEVAVREVESRHGVNSPALLPSMRRGSGTQGRGGQGRFATASSILDDMGEDEGESRRKRRSRISSGSGNAAPEGDDEGTFQQRHHLSASVDQDEVEDEEAVPGHRSKKKRI